ncbi:MAG: PEP-CTERM sorting domain-containing protein [Planctomycetota bacterium]
MRCLTFLFPLAAIFAPTLACAEVVLYSTGYEPPAYAVGPLAGQDDWTGFSSAVTADFSRSGSQSLVFDLNANFSFNQRPEAFSTSAPTVTMRQAVYIERPDVNAEVLSNFFIRPFLPLGENPNDVDGGEFLGQVVVKAGDSPSGLVAVLEAGAGDLGIVPVALDEWFVLELVLDLDTQSQEAYIDGQFLASAPFANPASEFSNVENLVIGKDNHIVFLDDLSITAVPEPGSVALLGLGSLTMLGLGVRRR